ncbi:MAG TPA: hypothetical protein VK149_01945 [Sideroxyarcus sp.]|nr:hypothetical protein [Sideroxyarcus sp.]
MIINNSASSASFVPSSTPDANKTTPSPRPPVNEAKNDPTSAQSTVVTLSPQAQQLSQSNTENGESRGKEATESTRLQQQERETKSNANGAAPTSAPIQKTASPEVSSYMKVAAQ